MKLHLWFRLDDKIPPKRMDCGAMVGWDEFFRPYLEQKLTALNTPNRTGHYYISEER